MTVSSRETLQALRAKAVVRFIEESIVPWVYLDAKMGCDYTFFTWKDIAGYPIELPNSITEDELLRALERRFPECSIDVFDNWETVWCCCISRTVMRKRAIKIDWSV
jgi:hypothetical protein